MVEGFRIRQLASRNRELNGPAGLPSRIINSMLTSVFDNGHCAPGLAGRSCVADSFVSSYQSLVRHLRRQRQYRRRCMLPN